MSADFLVELGTEELPPKALKTLMQSLADSIESQLTALELTFTQVKPFAAPRRLAVLVEGLAAETPAKDLVVWGPPAAIAFDAEGKPTKAALAFAEKNNIDASQLKKESDGKVEKLVARITTQGKKTSELLESVVTQALAQLPIAKRMKWGSKREEFVRPAHWLVMLYGANVVSASILGLQAGRFSRGHRFHHNENIEVKNPVDYANQLKTVGHVVVDFAERSAEIKRQVEAEAKRVGGIAVIDSDLLDEVTSLVEWPVALTGKFEESFLAVPPEALIASMKEHQKYFHVVDANGKLKNNFITVANIQSKDPKQIIDGNERVIRPRLSDAAFFYETDKKTKLIELRERLKTIVFQAQLGTIYDKTERIEQLANFIAKKLNTASQPYGVPSDTIMYAARICKSDLVTNMVGEFDDMQGIAGYYYAKIEGAGEEVATAMNEQYQPRFAGDQVPKTITGLIIGLADRLDTIIGIFGIGQAPTGSKDPFALRRASIAVLRILVEKNLALDLRELLTFAKSQHKNLTVGDELVEQVLSYMLERMKAWYEDANIATEVFQAVSARNVSKPLDINQRVLAVNEFSKLPQAQALAAANKRVANILSKQAENLGPHFGGAFYRIDLPNQDAAEKNLAMAVKAKADALAPLFDAHEYTKALTSLADLQPLVDTFFTEVMVMCDDPDLQKSRIGLLIQLRGLFMEVADISYLVPAKS